MKKKVFLGMSGGVDSAVSAVLLQEQGYDVTGVYMKNWSRDLPGAKCPWADDLADAKRVAVGLGIPFLVFDFRAEYKQKVVDYMLAEYRAGRTPNPDIMCNQEVKFKLFFEAARERGADYIATGHYAQTRLTDYLSSEPLHRQSCKNTTAQPGYFGTESPLAPRTQNNQDPLSFLQRSEMVQKKDNRSALLRAKDEKKDQTYFLYRISEEALRRTIFPVGGLLKTEVKELARKYGLAVAAKKESMGICFVGNVGMREFLSEFLPLRPGEIRDAKSGEVLGHHDSAIFYTIGQRHGLYLGGGLPYYVSGKDIQKNIVYVSRDLNDANLWKSEVLLTDTSFIAGENPADGEYLVRVRHQAPLIPASLSFSDGRARVVFESEQRALTPGQSVVVYGGEKGEVCLGGGIVAA